MSLEIQTQPQEVEDVPMTDALEEKGKEQEEETAEPAEPAKEKKKRKRATSEEEKKKKKPKPRAKKAKVTSASAKKAKVTSASAKKKATGTKKRAKIEDDLTPQRRREINHITRRAAKTPIITPSFLTSALRSAKLAAEKIARIGEYKATLQKQQEQAVGKAGDDEEKKERVVDQYKRKFERLDRIKEYFDKGDRVCLKAVDEVFLSKIKLPKPLSGYMLFAKETRAKIQSDNPDSGFGKIGSLIGIEWKKLTDEERKGWSPATPAVV